MNEEQQIKDRNARLVAAAEWLGAALREAELRYKVEVFNIMHPMGVVQQAEALLASQPEVKL